MSLQQHAKPSPLMYYRSHSQSAHITEASLAVSPVGASHENGKRGVFSLSQRCVVHLSVWSRSGFVMMVTMMMMSWPGLRAIGL